MVNPNRQPVVVESRSSNRKNDIMPTINAPSPSPATAALLQQSFIQNMKNENRFSLLCQNTASARVVFSGIEMNEG